MAASLCGRSIVRLDYRLWTLIPLSALQLAPAVFAEPTSPVPVTVKDNSGQVEFKYGAPLRDTVLDGWKLPSAEKGSVYVLFRLSEQGIINNLYITSEPIDREAEHSVVEALSKVKPLGAKPSEVVSNPNAWMLFSWGAGDLGRVRSVSGPYFDKDTPTWVNTIHKSHPKESL